LPATAGCSISPSIHRDRGRPARGRRQRRRGAVSKPIAYTGTFGIDGDQVFFDLDVSWNESWTGTRQVRTFELKGNRLMISAEIINPMTGKPARHRLMFEKVP
jgi:hypothetical protein